MHQTDWFHRAPKQQTEGTRAVVVALLRLRARLDSPLPTPTAMPFNDETQFPVWRWTHLDVASVAAGRRMMRELRSQTWGRKSAVIWQTYTEVEGGFQVQWKEPACQRAVHRWLWGRFKEQV